MNQHTSKRRQVALRFFTYGIMTFAVVAISLLCIFLVLGYRFDRTSGQIEQQALLQFRSTPSNARVELDGRQLSFTTPGRRNVSSGEHTVAMRLEGYRDWAKTFNVEPGSIMWLNYARFVPNNVTTDATREFDTLTDMRPSPDRRWLALLERPNNPSLTIADIRNEDQPRFSQLSIPREVLNLEEDQEPGEFAIAEWDFGSRYLLVTHKLGDKTDFLRLDRTDASAAKNISQQLNIDIKKAHFIGTSGNRLYALTGTDVRSVDLGGGTITRPLISNVNDFMLYRSDTIAFTATRDKQKVAGVYKEGEDEVVVRTFDTDKPVRAAVSGYFNDIYLAVAHGEKVEVIKNPLEDGDVAGRVYVDFTVAPDTQWLQFASSGRFVIAQKGNTFTTYDLEHDAEFTTTLAETAGEIRKRLRWLDDFHLWTDVGGEFRMTEFDGANQQVVTSVAPGYGATLSSNGERLFTIGKNDAGKFILQSSRMVLD